MLFFACKERAAGAEKTRAALLLQVAVDFWAPWCEPCKALDEVFALLAADNRHAKFLRVRPAQLPISAAHLLALA